MGTKKKSWLLIAMLALTAAPSMAQYRVDRLITAGRSALFYEDYVLSIKYFNLAIGAKPYLYEPWYFRSVAKFSLDDYMGAESDATEALQLNPYVNDIYDLRAICRIRQNNYEDAIKTTTVPFTWSRATATIGSTVPCATCRTRNMMSRSTSWTPSSPSGRTTPTPTR